jgi:hypothetical protein
MSNVQITNGVIKYGRTIKTGDFESKRGDVELSFNIPEGEDHDAAIARVHDTVKHHIHNILGHAEDQGRIAFAKAAGEKIIAEKAAKSPKKLPPAAKSTDVEEDLDPLADRAALPKFIEKEVEAQNAKAREIVDNDPLGLGDLMGEGGATKEITDKELTDATQKCQSRAKNAPAIRKALNELGVKTPPGRIIDLPQEKRQTYLNMLEAIKPLA